MWILTLKTITTWVKVGNNDNLPNNNNNVNEDNGNADNENNEKNNNDLNNNNDIHNIRMSPCDHTAGDAPEDSQ